ncbi:chromate efflux transporter [Lysobacter humi (ex Lee et al. 2017)]
MNSPTERPRFGEALRFWALLGCISFGGPAGQIAIMHTELVDKRRWVDEATFLRGLNFCMLLPGPEAMQLAAWLGWRLHGLRGGLVAGSLFVLPAALLLAALAWLYMRFGTSTIAVGIVFGLQAAVLGIVVHAAIRIGARILRTPFALVLAVVALLLVAALQLPFPLLLLGAALVGIAVHRWRPAWLPPPGGHGDAPAVAMHGGVGGVAHAAGVGLILLAAWWIPLLALRGWLGPESTAASMGLFFSKAALVTFGGAYAVLPYVATQAVETHGWLDAGQMMAGLGLAETTPGPLVLVLEFVGFVGGWQHPDLASPLASALLGAGVAVWATFLPSFLFVLTLAPWIEGIGRSERAGAALAAITSAVVGVIVQLALWFGMALVGRQVPAAGVAALAIAGLVAVGLSKWKWPVAAVVPAATLAGVLLQQVMPVAA